MKKEMLKELLSSTGKISSMRWAFYWCNKVSWTIAFIAVVGCLGIGVYAVVSGESLTDVAPYASAVLIGAASIIGAVMATANIGKAAQSYSENKSESGEGEG